MIRSGLASSKSFTNLLHCLLSILLFTLLAVTSSSSLAQDSISFTTEQVDNGSGNYKELCQLCHGSTLTNGQFGTPLRGSFFQNNWAGKSIGELIQQTYESMPPDNVMSLTTEQYAELVAFILEANNIEPGEVPLSSDYKSMTELMLPW